MKKLVVKSVIADAMTAQAEVIEKAAQQLDAEMRARPTPPLTAAERRWLMAPWRSPIGSTRRALARDGLIDSQQRMTVWGVEVRRRLTH